MSNVLGKFCAQRRHALNLGIAYVARAAGTTETTLTEFEKGRIVEPCPEFLTRLIRPLKIDVDVMEALERATRSG